MEKDLVTYVLKRVSIKDFNAGINEFSCQRIYSKVKRQAMMDFPELMPTDLRYSVAMSEAFEPYKVPEIQLKEMEPKLRKLEKLAKSRYLPTDRKRHYRSEYNDMVREWNRLIEPQNKLIKRYKELCKNGLI